MFSDKHVLSPTHGQVQSSQGIEMLRRGRVAPQGRAAGWMLIREHVLPPGLASL